MSEEEKSKKREAFKKEIVEEITGQMRTIVGEEIRKELDQAVVPKNYERCPACGEVKKIGKDCPYCPKSENSEGSDDDLGLE